ncbi:type II toxin-antitoxin system RelE/ParE family toxin [Carboxylicivirga caseinilyticus]|uniref:type II toxin-antitoxin system RelE/ParE family toxin n=1 Tax=Carboxylicivirga caseinilyticus TaxID=3417572 RepID=UPI003D3279E3|nr:type II toxin-antitoxin system RelE/ParE family toxin [Marinilabiliaceae bacterium A049]
MANYKLTNKAVEDLNKIWDSWSEYQADKYYEMLIRSCEDIANNPALGKNYTGITSELFGLKANRHIIFYRKSLNCPIEIIRILHEQMDLKSRITE